VTRGEAEVFNCGGKGKEKGGGDSDSKKEKGGKERDISSNTSVEAGVPLHSQLKKKKKKKGGNASALQRPGLRRTKNAPNLPEEKKRGGLA